MDKTKINSMLQFNKLKYNSIAIKKIAKWHQSMIDDEPLACHTGVTLGYLRKALHEISEIAGQKDKHLKKSYTINEIGQLRQLHGEFKALLQDAEKKNHHIYKDVERNQKELPDIDAINQTKPGQPPKKKIQVLPKEPTNIFEPLGEL